MKRGAMSTGRWTVSLCRPTQTILNELKHPEIKQRSVALTYTLAIRSREKTDWEKVNKAIIARWSLSGLERVKKMAWKIIRDGGVEDIK